MPPLILDQPYFINRLREIQYLSACLDDRECSVVLIVGPPGIGKTALLENYLELLRHKNAIPAVVRLRSIHSSAQLTYEILAAFDKRTDEHGFSNHRPVLLNEQAPNLHQYNLPDFLRLGSQLVNETRIALGLDDLETVFDGQLSHTILEMVRDCATSPIPNLTLFLVSRPTPRLKSITSLPNVRVLELTSLSQIDVDNFIRSLLPRETPETEVYRASRLIYDASAGVPSALMLLLHSMGRLSDSTQFVAGLVERAPQDLRDTLESIHNNIITAYETQKASIDLLFYLLSSGPARTSFSIEEISKLCYFGDEEFRKIVADLSSSGILRIQSLTGDDYIELDQDAVHSFFRDRYDDFVTFDPTELDFGAEEAERDELLQKHFISRPAINEIARGRKNIIIGDRGSGKSAILKMTKATVTPESSPASQDDPALARRSEVFVADTFAQFIEQHIQEHEIVSADSFRVLWLLYSCTRASEEVIAETETQHRVLYRKLRQFLERVFPTREEFRQGGLIATFVTKFPLKLTSRISFSIGGVPITFEPSASTSRRDMKADKYIDVDELLSDINHWLQKNDRQALVIVDKIDECLKYDREKQEACVQGLFLAETYMSKFDSIKLVVLIRTDLYRLFDIQEKNKMVSRSVTLEWSEHDLLKLLLVRLADNRCLHPLSDAIRPEETDKPEDLKRRLMWVFPQTIEGMEFAEWLLLNLRNGNGRISPRQIITLLMLLRAEVLSTGKKSWRVPLFDLGHLEEALRKLSELSFEEVVSDFRVATNFVRNARAARLTEFGLDEVADFFDETEGSRTEQIETLERLGFLNRVVRSAGGEVVYRFQIPLAFRRCWV